MIRCFKVYQGAAADNPQLACQLAADLALPLTNEMQAASSDQAVFCYQQERLCLNLLLDNKPQQLAFDLVEGVVGFRAARVSRSNELVAKAIGCKANYRPRVLDATAGMGRDALIMAQLGCQVQMQERNFAIFHLLQNALERLQAQPKNSEISSRLRLTQQDSINTVSKLEEFDVVYLDPMFPERKKSALVKKEMRLFKLIAGEDQDADQLFVNAMVCGVKRVVVKRPKAAPVLGERKPSHEISGKNFRYDVYLLNQ